jgi:hypothetical protein
MLVVAGALVTGCGSAGGSSTTTAAPSDRHQIRFVLKRFNAAARMLDGGILCRDVLAPGPVSVERCARQVGRSMRQAPGNWQPLRAVGPIHIYGSAASVRVKRATGAPFPAHFYRRDSHWYMQVFD